MLSATSGTSVKAGENTFFETHCYAPIDVMKPFEIQAKVNIKQLAEDRLVGLVFNYRDGGNFYAFSFNDDFIKFTRYEDNMVVGDIMQSIKWTGKRRSDMEWTLISDGQTLTFKIDGYIVCILLIHGIKTNKSLKRCIEQEHVETCAWQTKVWWLL